MNKYYINHTSGKIYTREQLGLDKNEEPCEDRWSEIIFNDDRLPEVKN